MQKSILFLFVPIAMIWFNGCDAQEKDLSQHSKSESVKRREVASQSTDDGQSINDIMRAKACVTHTWNNRNGGIGRGYVTNYRCNSFDLDNEGGSNSIEGEVIRVINENGFNWYGSRKLSKKLQSNWIINNKNVISTVHRNRVT